MPPTSELTLDARRVRLEVDGEPHWGRLDGDSVVLDDGAVEVGAQREVGRVELVGRRQRRADRQEAVLALDAQHRATVGVAEVVHADIVRAGVAGDVRERIVEPDALHSPPDDHRELAFVVEEPGALRHEDRTPVPVERRRRLHEVRRLGRRARRVLLDP